MADQHLRLEATPLRYATVTMLPMVSAMAGGVGIGWISSGNDRAWFYAGVAFCCGLGGALIGSGLGARRTRIELQGEMLEGLGRSRTRVVAAGEELDRDRSARRNAFQRFVGEQVLWFRNGERIFVNHRWYGRGELAELLHAVGVGGANS